MTRQAKNKYIPTLWVMSSLFTFFLILFYPQDALAAGTRSTNTFGLVAAFFGGLLTALTPCVYPVIPLVISQVGKWGKISRKQAAIRSGSLVLGMIVVYTSLGVVAGLTNSFFGSWTASPAFRLGAALLMWVFAAGLLGAFVFRLPTKLTSWASGIGGTGLVGAFLTGTVSGVLSAGCTGPVLAGILTFIAASQSIFDAITLMLAFSVGLGIPFFLLGILLPSLPRPGQWLIWVEAFLGIALIATGAYFAAGALQALGVELSIMLSLIALLAMPAGIILWIWAVKKSYIPVVRSLAILPVILISIGMTGTWIYVSTAASMQAQKTGIMWETVDSSESFERLLAENRSRKPILVDFHADWCADCRQMEKQVFSDPDVSEFVQKNFFTIRIDATAGAENVMEVAKKYGVPGVPALRFFSSEKNEQSALRRNGPIEKEAFLKAAQTALSQSKPSR